MPCTLLFKTFAAALISIATFTAPANAGDFAQIDVLGFSNNGRYFAFEQFGIQDGSGFPYSDIFVVDVSSDKWVKPSPFRRLDQSEVGPGITEGEVLDATRAANRASATPLLASKGIAGRGRTVGHNPPTELNSDPFKMTVNPHIIVPAADDPMEFRLTQYSLPAGDCASYGANTMGFKLTLDYQGLPTRTLNQDWSLPKSRGCPLRYRINRVVTHVPAAGPRVFAILVLMETHGFEGPDGRYIAITGTF